jgi:lipopolysaccharide transport system ATP-binding protein
LKSSLEVNSISKAYRRTEKSSSFFLHDIFSSKKNKENDFIALSDINFSLVEGDVLGIIGRNGAGKSTLLKIISRVVKPTSGNIKVRGRIASLLEVGTGFHPELTGIDNIYLNGAILGMKRAEINRHFKEITEFADIGDFINTPVKRYSSGMTVRLGFAVAAHLNSDILIVDEVLAVGDQRFQEKCLNKIGDISSSGKTILFVSHNNTSVKSLCNKGLLLENGKAKIFGAVDDVLKTYLGANSDKKKNILNMKFADDKILLKSIEVLGESDLTTNKKVAINISFEVFSEAFAPGFVISVCNILGDVIFSSINNRIVEYGSTVAKGTYNLKCLIPGNLLNSGKFFINLNYFYGGYSQVKTLDSVLNLDIFDSNEIRGDYSGDYGGYIRPLLDWKLERNSSDT